MNAPAQCRLASPEQAPELLALWQIGQLARRGEPIPTTYLPQPDPGMIERLHAARYVVVTAAPQGSTGAGRASGMAVGMQAAADRGVGDPIPGLLHLTMVAVLPAYWGQGIGAALVQTVLRLAAKDRFDRAQLWVVEDNVRARRLYERLGVVASGQRKQDAADETIVHYAIDLPPDAG